MNQPLEVPRVWELLEQFKASCHNKGWKTSEYEDIVEIDEKYHNFIGARAAHPSTFSRIASKKKLAIPEGKSYRVIDISFTAWIFQQQPPEKLVKTLNENPEMSRKIALYDLSSMYKGKPLCLKLNKTSSLAFDEFENFLKEKYGVETKPLYEPRTSEPKTFKSKLQRSSAS